MSRQLLLEHINTERCRLDEKYFYISDQYTPNYKKTAVTAKFYSKYEGNEEPPEGILKRLLRARDFTPKQKMDWPETVNQEYGWFEPFVEIDKKESRFYYPKIGNEITRHGLKMLETRKKK